MISGPPEHSSSRLSGTYGFKNDKPTALFNGRNKSVGAGGGDSRSRKCNNVSNYACTHATYECNHFTDQPSAEIITAVDGQWSGLTEEGEGVKWSHYDDLNAAEADAREAILTTDWDNMVPAERKLAMNRTLSAEDKEALLVKFPQ